LSTGIIFSTTYTFAARPFSVVHRMFCAVFYLHTYAEMLHQCHMV